MQKIIYLPPWEDPEDRSAGVTIGLCYPYIIGSPRGLGGLEAGLLRGESPYAAGAPVYGASLGGREISFTLHIRGATRREMYEERRRLCAALAVYQGAAWDRPGRLYYENDAGVYWLPAVPTQSPDPQERVGGHYNRADVRFFCPDPFFKSVQSNVLEMKYANKLFSFPFSFPVEFGTTGYRSVARNEGSAAAPVVLRVRGTQLENPTITNARTGEYIRVVRAVGGDHELVINTSATDRAVQLVDLATGESASSYAFLDIGSRFFTLLPGENSIVYHGDENNLDAVVTLEWYSQYAGV